MATHTIKGHIIWEKTVWRDDPSIIFFTGPAEHMPASSEYANRAIVSAHEFEVEVPDSFDPTAGFIAELEEQKRQLRLKLAEELSALDERISKLQALPMPEEA